MLDKDAKDRPGQRGFVIRLALGRQQRLQQIHFLLGNKRPGFVHHESNLVQQMGPYGPRGGSFIWRQLRDERVCQCRVFLQCAEDRFAAHVAQCEFAACRGSSGQELPDCLPPGGTPDGCSGCQFRRQTPLFGGQAKSRCLCPKLAVERRRRGGHKAGKLDKGVSNLLVVEF